MATARDARAQAVPGRAEVTVTLGPLNAPAPLARTNAAVLSAGAFNETLAAAQRAQDLGLPSLAVPFYRQLLAAPGGDREALTLALATALLDAGSAAEAQTVLATLPEPHGAAWRLRAGLAALQLGKRDDAQASWNAIKADEVSPGDRAWYYFFTGALYDTAPVHDITRANEFYLKAEAAATTELSKARFQLAEEQVRLRMMGAVSPEVLEQTRKTFEQYQGRATGYDSARFYAAQLAMLNRGGEAVEFLQRRVLLSLPPQERVVRDEVNFLIGLIGDATRTGPARQALNQLLETGIDPQRQRQALQLLATASEQEPGRGQFRAELSKLISATPAHPIKESLLFYRAQLALAEKNYPQAEDDANALLRAFPGSPLRLHAFGVLTGSAWEQRRFRLAANNAKQARTELAAAVDPALIEARARLGVLEAEAWFRAGDAEDYRNAADAYAAALRERPTGVPPGDLMFQRVLAEIRSGSPNAARVLDEVEAQAEFDQENRWQAEWNLARELQTRGKDGIAEAYARVNRLLAAAAPPADVNLIKPDLRARMAWLQARLSFEAGEPERTLALADGLTKLGDELDAGLKTEIAATAVLLKAQAQFALHDEPHALETLKKLREDAALKKSDAAISSYLIEADYLVAPGRDRIVEAQKLLNKLADDFPDNAYAPYALYQAAVLAERLGQDDNYREANRLIVDLVKKYPGSDLVFPAQLKEGELLEKLNELPAAQRVYQELENKFPRHRDVVRAQLALARCLDAQAAGNPSYLATAQAKFEQLRNRVDAPIDVRVEAGYHLGDLLARRDSADKAVEVWWREVVQPFLLDDPAVAASILGGNPQGRYWMARTLVRTGDLLEQQEKFEEAKRAWSLVLETKLGYESLARARLARFGVPEGKP
jgi:outer membrane protein assembly factor BamD (BamD/ComL family)